MSASTKLSNSVKALCFLAANSPEPQSSAVISRHTGVNASKLRKLLADLAVIGVVSTCKGSSGGYVLARKPEEIHLQEIYCAIEDRKAFHLDVTVTDSTSGGQPAAVNKYFLDLFSEIQVEIENKMERISLASVIGSIS